MRNLKIPSTSVWTLLVVGLLLAGCDSVVDADQPVMSAAPVIAYNLEEGKSLNIESDVSVEFIELIADTRCPLEDVCEENGSVDAKFILNMDGEQTPFILSGFVGPEGKQTVRFDVGPYEVTLQQLDPYPMEDCDMDMPPVAKLGFQR